MKNKREKIIIRTSIISIITNILLAGFKAFVGLLANSIAIISDAVNNLSDALSGIITIIGTKLAGKAPNKKHPYGYGRIEYITSLTVSGIVLYAGITALVESVKKIINPGEVDYSVVTLVILVAAIIVKFVLGTYVKNKGKHINSDSLVASGLDAFNDAILSISVLVSAIIYLIFKINIEAYVGAVLSIFIIKAGFELIKESVDNMLGTRIESDLAHSIKKDIIALDDVDGAFDLILNDYGPNRYLGSVHIEVKDTLTAIDIDRISRDISKKILDKYGVVLHTIGVYSVNTKDKEVEEIRKDIHDIVFKHAGILQMHGFYLDKESKTISYDIIIDFKVDDIDALYKKIIKEIENKYKDYEINIALDLDISD